MSNPPITPAQTDALAKLAEIPAVGSEERNFWLMDAERHGFSPPRDDGSDDNPPWLAWPGAILTLMSEARKQGQADVLGAGQKLQCNADRTALIDFLEGLAENAEPGQRKALNPILIGRSAEAFARELRAALATGGARHD